MTKTELGKSTIGEALRRTYRLAGVRQGDLADSIGVSQSTISDWIKGRSEPSASQLVALDHACGQAPGHIMREAGLLHDGDQPNTVGTVIPKGTNTTEVGTKPIPLPYVHWGASTAAFVNEIRAVTQLREDVRAIELHDKGGLPCLIVFGPWGEMRAVGVVDGHLTPENLDLFCDQVHGPIHSRHAAARSELVHTGSPDLEVKRRAARRGVLVKTWAEYQELLDFSAYRKYLRKWLRPEQGGERIHRLNNLYPLQIYLSQRYRSVDKHGVSIPKGIHNDLDQAVLDDLLDEGSRFVLILGDPGFGKSFLIRRLTDLLINENQSAGVTPIVIELRGERGHSLDEMVAATLARTSTSTAFQGDKFSNMFHRGRVVLLVDGYDEFAVRVGYGPAAEQLRMFLAKLRGRTEAKIVLTTRPNHFRDRRQIVSKLFEDVFDLDMNQRRVYELLDFEKAQQRAFLARWFTLLDGKPDSEADALAGEWIDALDEVNNLPELARTPRMLSFMANDLDLDQIRAAKTEEGPVTAARLYEMLVDTWLTTEATKFEVDSANLAPVISEQKSDYADRSPLPAGKSAGSVSQNDGMLTAAHRWEVVEELAFRLWATGEPNVSETLLETVAGEVLDLPGLGLTVAEAAHEIGSRTLLVGEGDRRYFTHQSVFEFLLARKLVRILNASDYPAELGHAKVSELSCRFLYQLDRDAAAQWLEAVAKGRTG